MLAHKILKKFDKNVCEIAHYAFKIPSNYLAISKKVIFNNKSSWTFAVTTGQVLRA